MRSTRYKYISRASCQSARFSCSSSSRWNAIRIFSTNTRSRLIAAAGCTPESYDDDDDDECEILGKYRVTKGVLAKSSKQQVTKFQFIFFPQRAETKRDLLLLSSLLSLAIDTSNLSATSDANVILLAVDPPGE